MQLAGSLLLATLLILSATESYAQGNIVLASTPSFPPDFNFHNKDLFLKDNVLKLVDCVRDTVIESNGNVPSARLSEAEALRKGLDENGNERFIFEYNGTRGYKESCLGDAYKNDLFYRIYDGFCTTYEDKIRYVDSFSCDANQHLECRQVGNEPERKFAEQNTPIMQCLCPDYGKTQAYLDDNKRGYYDKNEKKCVLKVGQICQPHIGGIDARWKWRDIDYVSPSGPQPPVPTDDDGGIDVVDLRPTPHVQACVKNAFCFIDNDYGLKISKIYQRRCVCNSGYFPGRDGECHKGTENPSALGVILATILFTIAVASFIGGVQRT